MVDQHETANIIGADVSSQEFVVAWAHSNKPVQTIVNNRQGILAWLRTLPANAVIGMEATGRYHHTLADCAAAQGHTVYVINPKHLAHYARGVGQRGKTDPLDARVIARYVDRERDHLYPYVVPSKLQRSLRSLLSQRAGVVKHCGAIRQNLRATHTESSAALRRATKQVLNSLVAMIDRKSTRLNSSHVSESRMPSSA